MGNNIGEIGVESMRLGGMSLDELPIAEAAGVSARLPAFLKTQEENTIDAIKGRHPKQTIAWCDGAIRTCELNITNIRRLIGEQRQMITDYTGHISLCKHRDKELAKTDDPDEIKEIKKQFPLYDVKAMEQQIQQCNEAIYRSDKVIDQEHASIAEIKELRAKCVKRDEELKPYGAMVG